MNIHVVVALVLVVAVVLIVGCSFAVFFLLVAAG